MKMERIFLLLALLIPLVGCATHNYPPNVFVNGKDYNDRALDFGSITANESTKNGKKTLQIEIPNVVAPQILHVEKQTLGTPDGSAEHPYVSVTDALSRAAALGSGSTNPIVIQLGAGSFGITAYTQTHQYVTIRGKGQNATALAMAGMYTVATSKSTICDLSIVPSNSYTGPFYTELDSPKWRTENSLQRVWFNAPGCTAVSDLFGEYRDIDVDAKVFARHYLGARLNGGHWNISGTGILDYKAHGGIIHPDETIPAYLDNVVIYLTTLNSTGVVFTGGETGIRPDWMTGCRIEAMHGDGGNTVGAAGAVRLLACHIRANKPLIDLHDGSAQGSYIESGGGYWVAGRGSHSTWTPGPGTYFAGPHGPDPNFAGTFLQCYFESVEYNVIRPFCERGQLVDCIIGTGSAPSQHTRACDATLVAHLGGNATWELHTAANLQTNKPLTIVDVITNVSGHGRTTWHFLTNAVPGDADKMETVGFHATASPTVTTYFQHVTNNIKNAWLTITNSGGDWVVSHTILATNMTSFEVYDMGVGGSCDGCDLWGVVTAVGR